MNTFKYAICGAVGLLAGLTACTDLDEKVYDRIDASVYYQNEASVKGAVAAIYNQTSSTLAGENFFHLSEYPSDQITPNRPSSTTPGRVPGPLSVWPTCC